ncbi:glutamate carboxypeptidase [Ardenticatena maritima]|uniref:Glutamate carboxypeptidase n=2 Tax=Ardenticatena maritima TaxID=872965 RepID=A0A0M9UBK6_9CHLR|nr:M20 family metallopeptidase [Ardenticatena maritima]GAP61974.1 glutamate carboxypeptidase [Ardenticatena maritima]
MTRPLDELTHWMETHLDAYLADLAELVNVDCGTSYKPGVDEVGSWCARFAVHMGATLEWIPQRDYGDILLARWRGTGRGRILLSAHLDTVYPIGTAAKRPLRREGNRLLGPGVADMKAGLLSGLYALQALFALGMAHFEEIAYFFSSEEEVGSPVSRTWLQELAPHYDAGLVLEAGRPDGSVVVARKGGGFLRVCVEGREAHTGVEPEKGASAILELAHHIIALEALNGRVPGTTIKVTQVQGGTARNVVPGTAEAGADVRVVDEAGRTAIEALIRETVAHTYIEGTQVRLEGEIDRPPWPPNEGTERLYTLARQIAHELGFDIGAATSGGSSDGNFLVAGGLAVLDGLGPVGGLDHSPNEYLDVDSIVPRTVLLAELIRRLTAPA